MNKILLIILILSAGLFAQTAEIKTSKGTIKIELYGDKSPLTVANFINLANRGFYNNTKVHRVINDLAVQMGDPTGTGRGGPGYNFPDETSNGLKHDAAGVVSMVNTGPNTNGSQFFISINAIPWYNGKHTIFGKVTDGIDLIRSLKKNDKIISIKISGNVPKQVKDQQSQIDEWNRILDKQFPNLKPATPL
jgi:peptidyl-prolyl cis-trans isomerase B (cyclophilin B)